MPARVAVSFWDCPGLSHVPSEHVNEITGAVGGELAAQPSLITRPEPVVRTSTRAGDPR